MTYKQVQKEQESLEMQILAGIPTHASISSLFLLMECDRDFTQLHMQRLSKLYQQLEKCHGECLTQHIKPQLLRDMLMKCRASALRKHTNPFAYSVLLFSFNYLP